MVEAQVGHVELDVLAPLGHFHSSPALCSSAYDGAHALVAVRSHPAGKPWSGCIEPCARAKVASESAESQRSAIGDCVRELAICVL